MSPPCHAFWEGDNGGRTARGVSDGEIRIIYFANCPGGSVAQTRDMDEEANASDARAAMVRSMTQRYQTYGRRVHMWHTTGCPGGVQARVAALSETIDPFAVIMAEPGIGAAAEQWMQRGVLTIVRFPSESAALRHSPYVLSETPELEEGVAHVVTFLCLQLANRPPRFWTNVGETPPKRKFGLFWNALFGPAEVGVPVVNRMVRERCGNAAGELVEPTDDNTLTVARWREAGVTTVVGFGDVDDIQLRAESMKWYPEWFHVLSHGTNRAKVGPTPQMRNSFALFFDRREAERREDQHWYQAVRDGCSGCVPAFAQFYDTLVPLFWGIQAAGPRLSAQTVAQGLAAIPPHRSVDPFAPAAYFVPGRVSFIRDATIGRWNVAGTTRDPRPGCWAVVEDGMRYRLEDWQSHPGEGVFDPPDRWPCQGERTF